MIGHAALLPVMTDAVLDEARLSAADLDLVAVTVGPGSFTGIRAALALAHGIALAVGVPRGWRHGWRGARRRAAASGPPQPLVVIDSRRGRIFLERIGTIVAMPLDALPMPKARSRWPATRRPRLPRRLAARDVDVMLTDARLPMVRHVAVVAEQRAAGQRPARAGSAALCRSAGSAPAGGRAASAAGRMNGLAVHSLRRPAHAAALAAIHAAAFPPTEAWGEDAIGLQLALPGSFGLIDERGGMLLGRVVGGRSRSTHAGRCSRGPSARHCDGTAERRPSRDQRRAAARRCSWR